MIDIVKKVTENFFEKLWIEISELEITNESKNIYKIKLKSEDSNLLIWTHWQNLEAIWRILKLLIVKKSQEKVIIHIEVNDYLSSKDERLFDLVRSKLEYLNKYWKEIIMPILTPYERKKVHSFVIEFGWWRIYTWSVWEWNERRLHIYKMDSNITLDIDWVDI